MGSRGTGADTSYQGNKGFSKAPDSGDSVSDMQDKLSQLPPTVIQQNPDAVAVINAVANNPNATLTIYRATVGDSINKGDWVFLDFAHADRWTRTTFGRPKPNVKVVTMQVKASEVGWTGKNLEFMYRGKRRR